MDGLELICFEIISNVGAARSCYITAIAEAQKGNFDKAHQLIDEGIESYTKGHQAHAKLIQQEASGKSLNITLLLIHAEDQLMSADSFKIITKEFINVYKSITNK